MIKFVISGVEFIVSERTAEKVSAYLEAEQKYANFPSFAEFDGSRSDYWYYTEILFDNMIDAKMEMIGEQPIILYFDFSFSKLNFKFKIRN